MVDQHTVRAYDKDLDLLERRIAEMGGLAEKMVIDAVDALSTGDTVLAIRWWRLTRASTCSSARSRSRRLSRLRAGSR